MIRPIGNVFRSLVLASAVLPVFTTALAQSSVPTLTNAVVLSKLDSPWDMAFLPDGTMFFTEKCNGLSVRQTNGNVVKLLGMKDSKGYPATAGDLFCEGQAGMSGVAVDPNFSSNRYTTCTPPPASPRLAPIA
jgi:aldose sugar dehydrogenase